MAKYQGRTNNTIDIGSSMKKGFKSRCTTKLNGETAVDEINTTSKDCDANVDDQLTL